jgi:hypothetical protein
MLTEVKDILTRSRATIVEDSLGVLALFALLLVCLHIGA